MKFIHKAPQTHYEVFCLKYFTRRAEQAIWHRLNANAITWIGCIPVFISAAVLTYYGGLQYHTENAIPGWAFIMVAFSIEFFSIMDTLDGLRARRTKCGSPCGRIIDEAGDTMVYSMFGHMMGYVVKVPPGWFTLGYALINIPQFAMEVNFFIEGNFKNSDEYCGPLEIELFLASIFFAAGIFGTDGVNKPLGVSFIPDSVHMVHILMMCFILLIANFTLEGIVSSI